MVLEEKIDCAGWCQGSLVKIEDVELLATEFGSLNDDERIIIISQSCDIIRSIEIEPNIEIIIAKIIDAEKGNYAFNKNPRNLHITANGTLDDIAFHLNQNNKALCPKVLFENMEPDKELIFTNRTVDILSRWLAARYRRSAFPNMFNDNISKVANADKKLKKQAKKISVNVSGLFLKITPFRELKEGERYSANLLCLVPADYIGDLDAEQITAPIEAICSLMESANIDVQMATLKEDKVPYSWFRTDFLPWSFDDISLKEDPPQATPLL